MHNGLSHISQVLLMVEILFLRAGRRQESVVSWMEPPLYHQKIPLNKFILNSYLSIACNPHIIFIYYVLNDIVCKSLSKNVFKIATFNTSKRQKLPKPPKNVPANKCHFKVKLMCLCKWSLSRVLLFNIVLLLPYS